MNRMIPAGRALFGVGLIGFGVMQFLYGDFIAGRAPAWPEDLPGRLVWAYLTGAILVVAGLAIVTGKRAREVAFAAGGLIVLWALVRNIPDAISAPVLGGQWTTFGKSLVFAGGTFAMGASFAIASGDRRALERPGVDDALIYLGRWTLGLFMILCGIQHFVHVAFVVTLVPTWIPGAYFWTYFGGLALIAGGTGLLIPRFAALAAALTGIMLFLWVLMLHIPRATSGLFDTRNEWTSVFEATALSGLSFVLSRVMPRRKRSVVGA